MENDVEQPFNYLKLATGWLPLSLAAAYLLGFAIVGIHLASYGAPSLDLFKGQYLAAGFWFCASYGAYFGLLKLVRSIRLVDARRPGFNQQEPVTELVWAAVANFVVLFLIAFILVMIYYISPAPEDRVFAKAVGRAGMLWSPFVFAMAILDMIVRVRDWSRRRLAKIHQPEIHMLPALARTTPHIIMVFALSLMAFALLAYRTIPFSLGGGKPRQVKFWLGSSGTSTNTFLDRDGTTEYSVPYELLVESENSLVVVSPKDRQRAIEFDRRSVPAVVILGNRWMAPAHFERDMTEGKPAQ